MTLLLTMIGKVKMIIETGSTETHKALASQSQLFDATVSKNKENGSGWRCPDNVAPLHITCCTSICKRP